MPVAFGPSQIGERTMVPAAEVYSLSYITEPDAVAPLLPKGFEVTARPAVSVAYIRYHEVDYLGGRGYDEVVVSVDSVFSGVTSKIEAPYVLVLWVNQLGALLTGREYQGFPKLLGELDFRETDGDRTFSCAEYGSRLIEGSISEIRPLGSSTLEKINRSAQEVVSLSWKHIPSVDSVPDADYPTKSVMRWRYDEAWTGVGRLDFGRPGLAEAPCGWRAARALAALPVVEMRPAFIGRGSAVVDRSVMARLR
jgi:acetoacetate decarboxylase